MSEVLSLTIWCVHSFLSHDNNDHNDAYPHKDGQSHTH